MFFRVVPKAPQSARPTIYTDLFNLVVFMSELFTGTPSYHGNPLPPLPAGLDGYNVCMERYKKEFIPSVIFILLALLGLAVVVFHSYNDYLAYKKKMKELKNMSEHVKKTQ